MKTTKYLFAAMAVVMLATSCGSQRKVESSVELPLRLEKAEYEIVGTFRHKTRNKYTYDVVLRDVRKRHGKDVDIANLKVDKKKKKVVVNGYVIRYKK